jgi:stage IV sporulation protein FB
MLGGEQSTPFDLKFRLGSIPVRVSPWFWVVNGLLGMQFYMNAGGLAILLIWVAVVFFSILIHELGHALLYRLFGSPAAILLHGFGGLAFGNELNSPVKRILVSLAGPFAQFLLAGVVFISALATNWPAINPYTSATFGFLLWVNIVWAIFNLLPILPLDGGNICREVFALLRMRNPDAGAAAISVAFAGTIAAAAIASHLKLDIPILKRITEFYQPGLYMAFWMIMFAVENFQRYQMATRMRPQYQDDYNDDTPPWRR